jgi:hypothetical protein
MIFLFWRANPVNAIGFMYLIEYLGSSRGKPSYIDPIEVLIVSPKLEFQSDSGITTVTWFRLPLDSGTNA